VVIPTGVFYGIVPCYAQFDCGFLWGLILLPLFSSNNVNRFSSFFVMVNKAPVKTGAEKLTVTQ
jgi:hypothetical protein